MVSSFHQDETFSEHDIVAILQDGRVIAMGRAMGYQAFYASGRPAPLNVRVPDLREIEYILNVQIHTDPATYFVDDAGPANKVITGNVVGFTIYGTAAATTILAEVIAIGPP